MQVSDPDAGSWDTQRGAPPPEAKVTVSRSKKGGRRSDVALQLDSSQRLFANCEIVVLQILVAFSSVNRPDRFEPPRRVRIEAQGIFSQLHWFSCVFVRASGGGGGSIAVTSDENWKNWEE